MSRLADRTAARREARLRRAELRVLATSRGYAEALDQVTNNEVTAPLDASDHATEALAALEAAALAYAAIAPRPVRRRRRARRA